MTNSLPGHLGRRGARARSGTKWPPRIARVRDARRRRRERAAFGSVKQPENVTGRYVNASHRPREHLLRRGNVPAVISYPERVKRVLSAAA